MSCTWVLVECRQFKKTEVCAQAIGYYKKDLKILLLGTAPPQVGGRFYIALQLYLFEAEVWQEDILTAEKQVYKFTTTFYSVALAAIFLVYIPLLVWHSEIKCIIKKTTHPLYPDTITIEDLLNDYKRSLRKIKHKKIEQRLETLSETPLDLQSAGM